MRPKHLQGKPIDRTEASVVVPFVKPTQAGKFVREHTVVNGRKIWPKKDLLTNQDEDALKNQGANTHIDLIVANDNMLREDHPRHDAELIRINATEKAEQIINWKRSERLRQEWRWAQEKANLIEKRKQVKSGKYASQPLTAFDKDVLCERVCELLLQGVTPRKINESIREDYKLSKYHCKQITEMGWKRMKELSDDDFSKQRSLVIRRYEDLYNKAIETKDYSLATKINKEITELFGLEQPKKIDIEHSIKPIEDMSNEELKQLIGDADFEDITNQKLLDE